jgi:hypothetical protein
MEGQAMKYPRYRVEKFKGGFIVSERCVRGFSYVYRNTGLGHFDSRESAEAAMVANARV